MPFISYYCLLFLFKYSFLIKRLINHWQTFNISWLSYLRCSSVMNLRLPGVPITCGHCLSSVSDYLQSSVLSNWKAHGNANCHICYFKKPALWHIDFILKVARECIICSCNIGQLSHKCPNPVCASPSHLWEIFGITSNHHIYLQQNVIGCVVLITGCCRIEQFRKNYLHLE